LNFTLWFYTFNFQLLISFPRSPAPDPFHLMLLCSFALPSSHGSRATSHVYIAVPAHQNVDKKIPKTLNSRQKKSGIPACSRQGPRRLIYSIINHPYSFPTCLSWKPRAFEVFPESLHVLACPRMPFLGGFRV
jgi:hypothetical protein